MLRPPLLTYELWSWYVHISAAVFIQLSWIFFLNMQFFFLCLRIRLQRDRNVKNKYFVDLNLNVLICVGKKANICVSVTPHTKI